MCHFDGLSMTDRRLYGCGWVGRGDDNYTNGSFDDYSDNDNDT